jgi:hypothetical protein
MEFFYIVITTLVVFGIFFLLEDYCTKDTTKR